MVETQKLRSGHTTSCGCYRNEIVQTIRVTHGHSRGKIKTGKTSGEYASWSGAKDRCTNPRNSAYANYGGRGITMCDAWLASFEVFLADMGQRPAGHTLDRRDNERGYEPGNCRWATKGEQTRNQRKTIRVRLADGTETSLRDFAIRHGVPYLRVYKRVRRGMSPEEALYYERQVHCATSVHCGISHDCPVMR